jgi:hypothetical protein
MHKGPANHNSQMIASLLSGPGLFSGCDRNLIDIAPLQLREDTI